MTTDQHNTQAAVAAKLENIISGHRVNQDDAAWLRSFAQPATPPIPENAVVTSASGSTWEVDQKWAPALQAALDGRATPPSAEAASDRRPWAIFDSQGFYRLERSEVEARAFCDTYNARNPNDPLRPYTCCAMDDVRPPAQPTPELSFAGIAARKLDDLKAQGYMVDGYSIQHTETKQRGFITSGGFVGWWVNKDHVQPTPEPVAHRCRDLSDADMDQIAGWLGELERGDIGYHALCGKIIASFVKPVALQGRDERDQIEAIARAHGTGGWQTLDDMVRFGLAVWQAARASLPAPATSGQKWVDEFYKDKGYYPSLVQAFNAGRASLPAGGVVEPTFWHLRNARGPCDWQVPTRWPTHAGMLAEYDKAFPDRAPHENYPLYAAPQPSETQPKAAPRFDVTLNEEEAGFLRDTLGTEDDATPLRLLTGHGHSGYGLYVAEAEQQQEGASLLKALPEPSETQGRSQMTDEMLKVLKGCRDTAMAQSASARVPECGVFGGIAQDLDWLVSTLATTPQAGQGGERTTREDWRHNEQGDTP